MSQRKYAYGIVSGSRRIGGAVYADDMDDAVRVIAERHKLSVYTEEVRTFDGTIIPHTYWRLEGHRANIHVDAPAKYFNN